jgi:hypothetical protein
MATRVYKAAHWFGVQVSLVWNTIKDMYKKSYEKKIAKFHDKKYMAWYFFKNMTELAFWCLIIGIVCKAGYLDGFNPIDFVTTWTKVLYGFVHEHLLLTSILVFCIGIVEWIGVFRYVGEFINMYKNFLRKEVESFVENFYQEEEARKEMERKAMARR